MTNATLYHRSLLCLCLTALLVAPRHAIAQVLYGSIVGNVRDASEAPVPNAEVSATNRETNQSRQTVTNESGGYTFATLPSGTYDIKVSHPGFQIASLKDIGVTINSVARADVKLAVGAVTESIQVTADSLALQTDRSEVRAEVTTKTLENLPVPLGRNYQNLFVTIPGFTPPANAHSIPSNPSRSLVFNVNGTSRSSNNVRLDGASSTNIWLPHVSAYVPALEAIETVNVVTNSFDAEQGLAGGAAINVQIKSGTNSLHGSAFEYHNDNKLNAKPFFTPAGERNPKRVYNQFGGTVGGPIKHDKLFYFVSYEGSYDRQFAAKSNITVPTMAMRRGDFSASPNLIYDPRTGNPDGTGRTPFAGNLIPADRMDPIVQKIIALIPPATFPDRLTNNFYASGPFMFDRHTLDNKVNWHVSEKLSTFARVSWLKYNMSNQQSFGDALGGPPVSDAAGNPGKGFGGTWSSTLAATYILKPTFIIDAYFGYTLMDTNVEQPRLDEKIGLDFLGIPGTNGPRRFEGGWPRFSIDSFTNLGINEDYMPYFRHDPQFQYVANASWTKGTHNIRFGMDLYRQHLNHTQPELSPGATHGAQGGFAFAGGPTALRGGPAPNQFNSFATFLLGLPTNAGRILETPDQYSTRMWAESFYVRDQWQVNRRVTLSYGLRYELFPIPTRDDRGLERYDATTNKMLICGFGIVPQDCGVQKGNKSFAPRFGIAWRATDTFVVRAGYGITNDPYSLARPLRANYPILLAAGFVGPNSFQPEGLLKDGIPLLKSPDLGNGVIDMPLSAAVNTLPQEFRRGYIQSWNFTLQKQLPKAFTVQAGYIGTRQIRQLGYLNINAGRPGGGTGSQPLFARFGRSAQTNMVTGLATGKYDALQTSLNRRFANGVQFNASYTFSKALGIAGVDDSDNNPSIQIPEYYFLNRSLTGYDRTHHFTLTTVVELPFGKGKRWFGRGGVASAIAGGWQVNALLARYSGTPFNVSSSGTSLDAPGNTQRADQIKSDVAILGGTGPRQKYFDVTAYRPVTDARFGTAGFRTLRGPGLTNVDFGLFRQFNVTERWRLQFRAEGLNLSNTPHFSNPQGSATATDFGEISSTTGTGREGIDQRVVRFGLRLSF
jgi:hypothetical protein